MTNYETFGFGQNDSGVNSRTTKFKGEKGKSYRLSFAWWPGVESPKFGLSNLTLPDGKDESALTPIFIRHPQNYIEGVGYVLNKGPQYTQLAGAQPKMKIATLIVSWALGKNNKPTKESLFEELPEVQPWVIGADKYEKLKKMHLSGYPMYDWDIQADCEDSGFQKFTFLPAHQNIFKEMLKNDNSRAREIASHIVDRVRTLAPNLMREIGQDLTIDQLREKLGHEVASPVGDSVAGDNEVDDLLGSMLED
jgi:hypothetical protein